MTRYSRSPWVDAFPKSRIPAYPKQKGAMRAEVVVVGGGLTGCATAYALANAGFKTVLVEGDQIGRGATATSSGWIADDPGILFADLEKAIGGSGARRAAQAWRRAALDFAALLRRLDVNCRLEPRPSLTIASTPEQSLRLKKEHQARKAAGLDAALVAGGAIKTETGVDAAAAVRTRDGFSVDPYRACVGLAAAAAARGVQMFEHSPVSRITFTRKDATVLTAAGSIHTRRVVIATGLPAGPFQSLARHFWFRTTFNALTEPVPPRIRQQLGSRQPVLRDLGQPPHIIRWHGDQLLVQGADAETGPTRLREKLIVQRTGQLMYELSTIYPEISGIAPAFGWASDYARTAEGLPYIGAHRNFPHHLFAFGDSSHAVTAAFLASRIVTRQCSGEMDPLDDAFGFHR
jgi:glycine/D-amino acid oxidase-like deaminating enzyme